MNEIEEKIYKENLELLHLEEEQLGLIVKERDRINTLKEEIKLKKQIIKDLKEKITHPFLNWIMFWK